MTWRLTTIVSGAAPGADRGAIEAGIELGLRVQGWHTELEVHDAPPAYLENAKPTLSPRMRARLNVQDSDGTLILSVAPAVPAHALYADEACEHQRKPSLHVVLPAGGRSTILDDVRQGVLDWLREEKIHVLHVTGPTEREEPGVQRAVKDALVWIFEDFEDEIERPGTAQRQVREQEEQRWDERMLRACKDEVAALTDEQVAAELSTVPPAPQTREEFIAAMPDTSNMSPEQLATVALGVGADHLNRRRS